MQVAVTGATGFIGWHAARELRAHGHQVRALVRDLGRGERLLRPLGIQRDDLVRGDMADGLAVDRLLEGCDAVLHAAAAVSVTDPKLGPDAFQANLEGVRLVLGGAHGRGFQRIAYVSSSVVLFEPDRETTEASPVNPGSTHYGRSKAACEMYVAELIRSGARIGVAYPTGVVGPDDPGSSESVKAYRGFLRTTIQSSGGTQFVDVRDLACLLRRMLEEGTTGRVIAGGHYFDWDEFTVLIERVSGATLSRLRAPGWVLRSAGRCFDLISRLSGQRFPISGEGMEIATRMLPAIDTDTIAALGVKWRSPEETLADLFRWYLAQGKIPERAIPGLLEPSVDSDSAA